MIAKPVIKWAGGKYRLSTSIIKESQVFINWDSFDRYVEPFVGGGGMFFAVCSQFQFKEKVIADINPELVDLYIKIRDQHNDVLRPLLDFEVEFNALGSDKAREQFYYALRDEFNRRIVAQDLSPEHVALFVALNKLGFNGLYRVNSSGLFNVPFGKKQRIKLVDEQNLHKASELLQNTEILLGDFSETSRFADDKSLFYFDSPYRPLSATATFTSYAKGDFDDSEQVRLAQFCHQIYEQQAKFVLSNSDPKNSDTSDEFFDELYKDYKLLRINARRAISAKSEGRADVSEILVIGS